METVYVYSCETDIVKFRKLFSVDTVYLLLGEQSKHSLKCEASALSDVVNMFQSKTTYILCFVRVTSPKPL